jgi:hypothetical protein
MTTESEVPAVNEPQQVVDAMTVTQPEPKDREMKAAIDLVSQIVLGETNPATLFNEARELQGSETFLKWMTSGGEIAEHPLLDESRLQVIKQARQQVLMARRGLPFRTDVEKSAVIWLGERKRVAQLEEVLARAGTPLQQAQYRAGLVTLHQVAKPLLDEETFAPLRSLHLSPYVHITPEDVLTHMYGPGCVNLDDEQLEDWIVGSAIITDKPTHEERDLMEHIQTLLPGSDIHLFQERLGIEDTTAGEFMFCRCRNGITVTVSTENYLFVRAFASPRGDYFRPC